ncbi:hypothetical protein RND81_02G138800 [Saponaria officinalis]|uniref:Retrovirus-related Pol polyprotein from transposon TNT 1-94-like beta-barrel domain-containing protein n=1 Tax=Saponaria officinalis TaxID=3572 RepID=A0AAW1MPY8_SAPOF
MTTNEADILATPSPNVPHIQLNPALLESLFQKYVTAVQAQGAHPSAQARIDPSLPQFAPGDLAQAVVQSFAGTLQTPLPFTSITSSLSWIIDTGATDHMCPFLTQFHNIRSLLKPVHVSLPNGQCKSVHLVGDIRLYDKIILSEVLYVPEFQHNLLSASNLLSTHPIQVTFTKEGCDFQDLLTNERVLTGHKICGLFRVHGPVISSIGYANNVAKSNVPSLGLFHARLGHGTVSKLMHLVSLPTHVLKDFHIL